MQKNKKKKDTALIILLSFLSNDKCQQIHDVSRYSMKKYIKYDENGLPGYNYIRIVPVEIINGIFIYRTIAWVFFKERCNKQTPQIFKNEKLLLMVGIEKEKEPSGLFTSFFEQKKDKIFKETVLIWVPCHFFLHSLVYLMRHFFYLLKWFIFQISLFEMCA